MTRMQELKKTLKEATSSVFDAEPTFVEYHGFTEDSTGWAMDLRGWGDAVELRVIVRDPECDSYDVFVFNGNYVLLLEATVPLCAVIAAADSMVRSRQAK